MSDELILNFPVLTQHGGDFNDSVSYEAEAVQLQSARKLLITHTLKGESFISDLFRGGDAFFSVSLFYKDNAERQSVTIHEYDDDKDSKEITVEQYIDIDFSYAPEITPFIVIVNDKRIKADDQSGLTEFWSGEEFEIPAYTRLAHYAKLSFSSGDVASLMWKEVGEDYSDGSVKTTVTHSAGEGEQPIRIVCAQDVYDELDKNFSGDLDANMAMRQAIITQVLCHVYAHMNNLKDKENDIHSGLLRHMEELEEATGEFWQSDDFNASLAATKMLPYAVKALYNEDL